jgi:hypothetical protein
MAKVTIGGKEYLIGELNFIALRKSWSAIDAFMEADSVNPIKGAEVSLKIIAAAVQEEEYFKREDFGIAADLILKPSEVDEFVEEYLARQMKASEVSGVQFVIFDIMKEAGLAGEPGEIQAALETLSSLVTLMGSSPNLSQPESKVEVGTE